MDKCRDGFGSRMQWKDWKPRNRIRKLEVSDYNFFCSIFILQLIVFVSTMSMPIC